MAAITLENVSKSFGGHTVIPNLSLDVADGQFIVFVGPSGCGKSTLLRIIAGLEKTSAGRIRLGDRYIETLPPATRRLAMVFQSYALYPHMTVFENIAFGLRIAGLPKPEIELRVRNACAILNISQYLDRKPAELSGGQRQRVAIGRAIVREPEAFLFDEPLSNLDAALRGQMRVEIASLHRRLGATMIYVTHDQVEAMTMADRIVVLNNGRIVQVGTPSDIYNRPADTFVAGFIGSPPVNMLPAAAMPNVRAARIGVRPEHLSLSEDSGLWRSDIVLSENLGSDTLVHARTEHGNVVIRLPGEHFPKVGATAWLSPDRARVMRFDNEGKALGVGVS